MKTRFVHYRVSSLVKAPRKGKPNTVDLIPLTVFKFVRSMLADSNNPIASLPAKGGATKCTILSDDNTVLGTGWAYCSYSDVFCAKTGRELALERAKHNVRANFCKLYKRTLRDLESL